jgi:DNA-binding response OmpR family regulator
MSDTAQILVVEDDAVLQIHLEDTLRTAGFDPVIAANSAQAIVALEATGQDLRALVMSIKVGDGPDGWAIARRARELKPSIPVVYISGSSPDEWAVNGVPNSLLVEKPFATAQVVVAVSALLLKVAGG